MPKQYIRQVSDVPSQAHWAIFTNDSVHVPGDERSRQYPGHGYPEHTERFLSYVAFSDKAEWLTEIEEKEKRKEKYIACQIFPATVQTKLVVEVLTTPTRPHVNTQLCPKCHNKASAVYRDGLSTRECNCGHTWLPKDDYQPD